MFVRSDALRGYPESVPFMEFERNPQVLFPPENFTYLVSDFRGSAVGAGKPLPWGIKTPYTGPTLSGDVLSITDDPEQTLRAYTKQYGSALTWPQDGWPNVGNPDAIGPIPGGRVKSTTTSRDLLRRYVVEKVSPICIVIEHLSNERDFDWICQMASLYGYQYRIGGGVIALLRSS
jgi:hypothetical protein